MNSEELTYQYIEDYLNGQLTDSDKKTFEVKLKNDPEFKVTYDAHLATNKFVHSAGLIDVKSRLDSIHRGNVKPSFNRNKFYLYSLAIIAIVGIGIFLITKNDKTPQSKSVNSIVDDVKDKEALIVHLTDDEVHIEKKGDTMKYQKDPTNQVYIHEPTQDTITVVEVEELKNDTNVVKNQKDIETKDTVAIENIVTSNPCENIKIDTKLEVLKGSCLNEKEGQLTFDERTTVGGQSPYSYSIDNVNFKTTAYFSFLGPGKYHLYTKDANGCVSVSNEIYEVSPEKCADVVNDYSIYSANEDWQIPMSSDFNGELIVTNKNGNPIYYKEIKQGQPSIWSGIDNSGVRLTAGNYLFKLFNIDGSLIEYGTISIIN